MSRSKGREGWTFIRNGKLTAWSPSLEGAVYAIVEQIKPGFGLIATLERAFKELKEAPPESGLMCGQCSRIAPVRSGWGCSPPQANGMIFRTSPHDRRAETCLGFNAKKSSKYVSGKTDLWPKDLLKGTFLENENGSSPAPLPAKREKDEAYLL